ncbi:MAG: glycoside hydrolase family 71/99-like protein [Planctomycetota bacterium]
MPLHTTCSVVAGLFALLTVGCISTSADADPSSTPGAEAEPAKPEIRGRVVTGYQGWFRAPGDGSGLGWVHWGTGEKFDQRLSTIDLWPDMSEYTEEEKFPTPYRHADGSVAHVFSSTHPRTVLRHFEWMRDYGIGGAMQQRFIHNMDNPPLAASLDVVLANTRAASRKTGVPWALMYDLTGLKPGEFETLLHKDIRRLILEEKILEDPYYLHHNGKPLIAVWGVGFSGRIKDRGYTINECIELVDMLQNDPEIGGSAVMLGIPYWWRGQFRDATNDPQFLSLLRRADIISPWSIGRVRDLEDVEERYEQALAPDIAWSKVNGPDYLPVIYSGFSWVNLHRSRGLELPEYNVVPRLGGQFLWAQAASAKRAGAEMIYIAMFDEVDEATAIFKVTNDPPVNGAQGERFISYGDDVPSDHYLWLAGEIGRLIRGEIPFDEQMPTRSPADASP